MVECLKLSFAVEARELSKCTNVFLRKAWHYVRPDLSTTLIEGGESISAREGPVLLLTRITFIVGRNIALKISIV